MIKTHTLSDMHMKCRLVFSRFLNLRGNFRNVIEKLTENNCFSREKKRLVSRVSFAQFCMAAFL